jgi:hypothetical protein
MSNTVNDNLNTLLYIFLILVILTILGSRADRNKEEANPISIPQNSTPTLEHKGDEPMGCASATTAKPKSYNWADVASLKQQTLGNLDATDRLLNRY